MDFEFETKRTGLANAFAEAGAKLLGYQPLVSTAVAMIPGASPQKYAVAGTLNGILSMAGKMMGEDGVTGLEGLMRYDDQSGACLRDPEGEYVKFADVERLLAAPAAVSQPIGDLTDEQIERVWIELPLTGAYNMAEARIKFARAIERAAIAAYLARQPKAEHPVAVERLDNEDIDIIWASMPGGPAAWLKSFGYQQFAKAIEDEVILNYERAYLARQAQADPVTRLDVLSLIHAQCHRVYASAIDREEIDTKYMAEIEDALSRLAAPAPAGAQNAEAIRNQALGDAIEATAKVGCIWIDDSNRGAAAPILNEAIAAIRELQTGSANTQEGGNE
jgi:hypothetical protein